MIFWFPFELCDADFEKIHRQHNWIIDFFVFASDILFQYFIVSFLWSLYLYLSFTYTHMHTHLQAFTRRAEKIESDGYKNETDEW